jgi:peptidoglycan-N-acetylglucosamine deacetylase
MAAFFMGCVAAPVLERSCRTRSYRKGSWATAACFVACLVAPAASASDCPGHPNALGTSRTLVVDPKEHPRIGTMQYAESVPLADHEVVLTFDDGPLPRYSNQILEILASQCVKATFFTIGRQAQASPEGVRKLRDAGHTIATHTQNHPLSMNRMAIERARQEIDEGIASVKAALGDDADKSLAPFFRFPGLLRADRVEAYLAEQGIQVWSTDFLADDWHHISSSRVYDLAMKRLEARGKGILLLHDIHARTVAALPRILSEFKARGYHIVHVVPATVDLPPTPTEPQQWRLHPPPENVATARWPEVPNVVIADNRELPAPSLSDFDLFDERPIALPKEVDRPRPKEVQFPQVTEVAPENAAIALPVPAQAIFEIPEGLRIAMSDINLHSRHPEQAGSSAHEARTKAVPARRGVSHHPARRKVHVARHPVHGRGAAKVAGRASAPAATSHRSPQAKKRNVRPA